MTIVEMLQSPLSDKVLAADAVQKVFAGLETAQKVQVNESFDELCAVRRAWPHAAEAAHLQEAARRSRTG